MSNGKLALQLYTLRDHLRTSEDIEVTLKRVKEIGYNAVECAGLAVSDETAARMMSDVGLEVMGVHTGFEQIRDEPDAIIARQRLWGSSHVIVPVMPAEYHGSAESIARFARELSEAAKPMAQAGLCVSYHNHSFEFGKYDGKVALDILAGESDPELVCFEVDTYWVQHGGGEPAAWIRKLAGRVKLVHLKDMAIATEGEGVVGKQLYAEVGEGNLNWPAILDACREVGAEWYVVEQDTCQRDPFESVAISLKNAGAVGLS